MIRSTTAHLAGRRPARTAVLLAAGAIAIGVLSACGSGQITQTDSQVAPIAGVDAESRDGNVRVRGVQVPFAKQYAVGATVPVELRVFNSSQQVVRLTAATSDRGAVRLIGGATASPTPASPSATPSAAASPTSSASRRPNGTPTPSGSAGAASPTPAASPTLPGSATINLPVAVDGVSVLTPESGVYLVITGLAPDSEGHGLRAGQSVTLTLTFTYANGQITTIDELDVPVTVPLSPLPRPSGEGAAEEH